MTPERRAEFEALAQAIEKYGTHEQTCNEHVWNDQTWGTGCNCGFDDLLTRLRTPTKEEHDG